MENTQALHTNIRLVPQGRLAMWILIAGELVIFGGLIACYLLYRLRFEEWGEQAAHTSTFFGALNTFVLLTSSYTVVRAHQAALKKDLRKVTLWLLVTIAFGFAFLVNKTIEYSHEMAAGFTMSSPALQEAGQNIGATFWSFYYTMTGLHALHVVIGMTVMTVVLVDARKGQNLHRVELAGLYWHMVDIIWVFLFPLLYIAK